MSKMGSHDPFGTEHINYSQKSIITSISLRTCGLQHTVGKLLMRAITLL
jgi:hypothetical protein